jgi:serine/threonine protein kinase
MSMPVKWYALESLKHQQFTSKSDVWSFGVLLWEIFSYGRPPYRREARQRKIDITYINRIRLLDEERVRLRQPDGCPDTMYDIMMKCWSAEPNLHPSFAVICDIVKSIYAEMP